MNDYLKIPMSEVGQPWKQRKIQEKKEKKKGKLQAFAEFRRKGALAKGT